MNIDIEELNTLNATLHISLNLGWYFAKHCCSFSLKVVF